MLLLFPGLFQLNRRFLGKALLLAWLASTSAFHNMATRTLIRRSLATCHFNNVESKLCTDFAWPKRQSGLLSRLFGTASSVDGKSRNPKAPPRKRQTRSYNNTSRKKKSSSPQRATSSSAETLSVNATMSGVHERELSEKLVHMTLHQLRRECKSLGLKISGNKKTLSSRIFEFYEEADLLVDATLNSTTTQQTINRKHHYNPGSRNPNGLSLYQNGARGKESYPEHVAVCDPKKTYLLRVKGLSKQSYASAVGIQLFEETSTEGNLTETFETEGYHEGYMFFNQTGSPFEVEYLAIIAGVRYAYCLGARRINLQLSHNVINHQIQGKFPVSRSSLKKFYWTLQRMLEIDMQLDSFESNLTSAAMLGRARQLATVGLATGESSLDGIFNLDIVLDSMKNVTTSRNFPEDCKDDNDGVDTAPVTLSEVKTPGPSKAELQNKESYMVDPSSTYLLQFDGGCRGNPDGIAG